MSEVLINSYKYAGPTFDPLTAITWDVVYWANDPSWTNPGDGNAVSSWRDASGNGRDLAQATAGNKPTFRSAVANLNNRSALQFVRDTGTSGDFLSESSGWTRAQPFTVVAIISALTDPNDGSDVWRVFGSNSNQVQLGKGYPATNEVVLYAAGADFRGTSPATTADLTSANLFTWFLNGASSAVGKNGTVGTVTATPGTQGIATATFINIRGDTWQPADQKLAFFAVYNGDFTANGQYANFKSWVASYYGLTIA